MIKRIFMVSVALLMMLMLLFYTHPVAAQENESGVTIQQLRIQVMPEFDDPRVLVIVQGRLNAGAQEFPRPVTFRVPLGAQINQMATMDVADGSTTAQPYETAADPADPRWTQVTYTLDSAHFFYEFYYDPLASGREREFTYVYSTLQPVNDLQVEIQEPLRATAFAAEPAAALTRTDTLLGFTYHQFTPGTLAAGESWSARVTYSKPDEDPSLSREAVQAMQAGSAMQDGSVAQNDNPLSVSAANLAASSPANPLAQPAGNTSWLFAGVAVVLFAGGAVVVRSRWKGPAGKRDRPGEIDALYPANFCGQCGTAMKADARFCHACGNKLDA